MTPEQLEEIRKRDAAAGALWFTGPASFTALAARDRRELLALLDLAAITQVKVMHLQPNDWVIFKIAAKITDDQALYLKQHLAGLFEIEKNRVIVLGEGGDLEVLRKEQS